MLQGHQSWLFENQPVLIATSTIVGPEEGKGPLADDFDIIHSDMTIGETTWEKAERRLMEDAVEWAVSRAGITMDEVNFYIGGDLMNQIISSSFASRTFSVPYIGVFGACSTSMESLALAALMVNTGSANIAISGTCSHNSSVEKQFRYPTEYGAQKPPTAQFTVTGAAAAVVARHGIGPVITRATIGKVIDMGIKDPYNMGAAMAPAAVDTIQAHLHDFQLKPDYYDLIVTGDLAMVGSDIAAALFQERGILIPEAKYNDCGKMIYDRTKQQVHAGGSGCACSAVVTYGHLLKKLRSREVNKILVVATGALLSPITFQQKESIPCIAHAVAIENREE